MTRWWDRRQAEPGPRRRVGTELALEQQQVLAAWRTVQEMLARYAGPIPG
ncbi:hypothetical protein [Plantactinospora endophytica]|nr:hypothetical protein [Plantactinospora endophytica]